VTHLQLVEDKRPETGLLLCTVSTPAEVAISAKVGDRRRVVQRILPLDLVDVLRRLNRKAEAVVEAHLCRLPQSSLGFLARPIFRHKAALEAALKRLDAEYEALRDRLIARLPELRASSEAFALEHGIRPAQEFDAAWVERRFRLRCRWIPWMLRQELLDELFSADEQASIRAMLEADIAEAEREKARRRLQQLSKLAQTAKKALDAKRVLNRRTLAAIEEAAADLTAIAAGHEYAATADCIEAVVETLAGQRDEYDLAANREAAREGMRGAVQAVEAAIAACSEALEGAERAASSAKDRKAA